MSVEVQAQTANVPTGVDSALRARLGTQFTKMGSYRTTPYRIPAHQPDVMPGRQFAFTLPVQSLIDLSSFTVHLDVACSGKLNRDGQSDTNVEHRARLPDGLQTFLENLEVRISGTPISQIMGYNTVQKVKENIYETYDTLRKKNIQEGLFMHGVDARPETTGYNIMVGPNSEKLHQNLHALQKEVIDRFGRALSSAFMSPTTRSESAEHEKAMPTVYEKDGDGKPIPKNNYRVNNVIQSRTGPVFDQTNYDLYCEELKVVNGNAKKVEDSDGNNILTFNIPFDVDENYFNNTHKDEVWKRPQFMINCWRGLLGEIQPYFMDTSLLGPVEIIGTLANESILPVYDTTPAKSYNFNVGNSGSTNGYTKLTRKSDESSKAVSTGTILGRPTRNKGEYQFRNLYATVDVIQMPNNEFSSMAADLAQNYELEYLFKDYHTQPLKHTGITQFTAAATSLDHIYCVFRDQQYRDPSPPLRTYDGRGKLDQRWYMARQNRFFCPNIPSYRFTVNNAHLPMYDASPNDAYWQLKMGRTSVSAKIQTLTDWWYSFFVLPLRLCFPYMGLRGRSGINTRGMNAAMELEAKYYPGANAFMDVAVQADNGAGEIAPLNDKGSSVTVSMDWMEVFIISEYTATLRIGPGQDAAVED